MRNAASTQDGLPGALAASPAVTACVIADRVSDDWVTKIRGFCAEGKLQEALFIETAGRTARLLGLKSQADQVVVMPELGALEGRADALWRAQGRLEGEVVCVIEPELLHDLPSAALQAVIARSQLYPLVLCGPDPSRLSHDLEASEWAALTMVAVAPLLGLHFPGLQESVPAPITGLYAVRRDLLRALSLATGNLPSLSVMLSTVLTYGPQSLSYLPTKLTPAGSPGISPEELANEALRVAMSSLELHGRLPEAEIFDRRIAMADVSETRVLQMARRAPFATRSQS